MKRFLLFILLSTSTFAQDEWFFKDMLKGEIKTVEQPKKKSHYRTHSKAYYVDFTGDGEKEYLYFEFLDGKIIAHFRDDNKDPIYNFQFPLSGHSARVYRVLKKHISKNRIMLLFHYFEGRTSYLNKTGTASLYGGVIENGSFKDFQLKKLASIWLEQEIRDNYIRRLYEVGFRDVDNNGQKELLIKSGSVNRVIHYEGKGQWIGL